MNMLFTSSAFPYEVFADTKPLGNRGFFCFQPFISAG